MAVLCLLHLQILLMSAIVTVHCSSIGAPAEACDSIYPEGPWHRGPSRDLSTNTYIISFSNFDSVGGKYYYVPGQQYPMLMKGAENFRGFLVQARTVADDSPIGIFIQSGGLKLSECNPPESAVTHTNPDQQSGVTLYMTAPPEGTGEIHFLYAIYQFTYSGNSIFFATLTSDILNPCGLPLFIHSDHCLESCPSQHIGNTTTGTCTPFPSNYTASLNSTIYYAAIDTETHLDTPAYYIGISVEANTEPFTIYLQFYQNHLVESLFEFEGGNNNEIILTPVDFQPSAGGDLLFNTSINLVANPLTLYRDESIFPILLQMVITLYMERNGEIILTQVASGTGSVMLAPDPCDDNPCPSVTSTCISMNSTHYDCPCLPGYTGTNCEDISDPCVALKPCFNKGICETMNSDAYTCYCQPGFTGESCGDVSEPCLAYEPCVQGTCVALSSSEYSCDCNIGFTGRNCSVNIDDCAIDMCVNGTCVDGIEAFECECMPGFSGDVCDIEINECETAGCINGICTDLLNAYTCDCFSDYIGESCSDIIDDCYNSSCSPLGSTDCEDGNTTFICICSPGYTGPNCSEEIIGCSSNPCQNGGSCMNETHGNFSCICAAGYIGDTCTEASTACSTNELRGIDIKWWLMICAAGGFVIGIFLTTLVFVIFMHCRSKSADKGGTIDVFGNEKSIEEGDRKTHLMTTTTTT